MTSNQTDMGSLYDAVFSKPKQVRTADWANLANAISKSPESLAANPLLINELALVATKHGNPDVQGNALVCLYISAKNDTSEDKRTTQAIASALYAYIPAESKDALQQLNDLWKGNTSFGRATPTLEDGARLANIRHSLATQIKSLNM